MQGASAQAGPGKAGPNQPGRSSQLAAMAVLMVMLLLVLATFQDYGVSWDEHVRNEYGKQIVAYYKSGFVDRAAVTPNDEADDGNLPYYGGGFDLALALINRLSPLGTYQTRHLFSGLIGLIGLFAAMRLGEASGAAVGFLAMVLLATISAFYGHMFINPKDLRSRRRWRSCCYRSAPCWKNGRVPIGGPSSPSKSPEVWRWVPASARRSPLSIWSFR